MNDLIITCSLKLLTLLHSICFCQKKIRTYMIEVGAERAEWVSCNIAVCVGSAFDVCEPSPGLCRCGR